MGAIDRSTCANGPLGGPLSNRPADEIEVGDWKPGQKACMAEVRWPNGSTLKVGFLNRTDSYGKLLRQKVQEIASTWSQFANIKFEFVEGQTRDITINFDPGTAAAGTYSSQLGVTSALFSGRGEPSMHLVFDESNPINVDEEYRRVILHEFGHALGLIHEHARPDSSLVWDEDKVREYYIVQSSGRWKWPKIQEQVIDLYANKLTGETDFDPLSIMMYQFPAGLASYSDGRPFETDWNRDLSALDRQFIAKMYPT